MVSDDDSDGIENILKALESSPVKSNISGKSKQNDFRESESQPSKDFPTPTHTQIQTDSSKITTNFQNHNLSKSVRFASPGGSLQKQPSSFLSNMLFSNPQQSPTKAKPQDQPKTSTKSKDVEYEEKAMSRKSSGKKDDWLGMDNNEDRTEEGYSEPNDSYAKPSFGLEKNPKTINKATLSQEDLNDDDWGGESLQKLMERIELNDNADKERGSEKTKSNPIPEADTQRSKLSLFPPSQIKAGDKMSGNSVADFKRPSFGTSMPFDGDNITGLSSFSDKKFSASHAPPAFAETQEMLDSSGNKRPGPNPVPSLLEALPFLGQKAAQKSNLPKKSQENEEMDSINSIDGVGIDSQGQTKTVKKKVIRVVSGLLSTAVGNPCTLQLPSHLVNEEELKTMSSSLKKLYGNQMEMIEKSYKEQLDFLLESSKRREESLRDEMNSLQADYEQRICKLKDEISEKEQKFPEKIQQEMTYLSSTLQNISSQMEKLRGDHPKDSSSALNPEEFANDFKNILGIQIGNEFSKLKSELVQSLNQRLEESEGRHSKDNLQGYKSIHDRVNIIVASTDKNSQVILNKLNDVEKERELEMGKLQKSQKKLKDAVVNSTVASVTTIFENDRLENSRKKDRLAFQIKEFRKDFRRLYMELGDKNDSVHKSQLSLETEQKYIAQSIRDMNTLLKVSHAGDGESSQNRNTPSTTTTATAIANQLAAMQAAHMQNQNEMELKLLKEERTSVSESIAKLNVEKRKLSEEKVNFEKDKIDIEREKDRLREIDMSMQLKLQHAAELQSQAETMRQQGSKLSAEAESKLVDITRERSKLKEKFFEMEQQFMIRDQKFFQEKSEFLKDKEFLDKLQAQLICPRCLGLSGKGMIKSPVVNNLGSTVTSPFPYRLQPIRSQGDGLDMGVSEGSGEFGGFQMPKINLTPQENEYFSMESNNLKDLYDKHFKTS